MFTSLTFPRLLWAVAVLSTQVIATPASADRLATVVRGSGAGSDKAAGFVSHYVRQAFINDERYEVVDLVVTLGSPSRDRADRAFQVADEMIQRGREAYETLDLDIAIEHLNTALAKFERHAAYVKSTKRVAETLMLLGATHILRGEEKAGEKRLAQAISVYNEIEPDPSIFNPSMRQIFQRAADRIASRPTGSISLNSNPSYANVYIDGQFVGVTPTTIDDVPEGRHFVQLHKDGYRSWGRLIDVLGGSEAGQTATLKPTTHFDDFDSLVDEALLAMAEEDPDARSVPVSDAVDQLGVLLNADHLFLAETRVDGERLEVRATQYDLNAQRRMKTATQGFSYDSRPETYAREIDDLLVRHFGERTLRARGTEVAATEDGLVTATTGTCFDMPCDQFKLIVLVSGVGGGVLFMGLGSIMWALASGDNTDYRESEQISQEAEDLLNAGQAKAVVGDIFFFLGAAVAITGTILYFVWNPTPSAEEVIMDAGDSGGGWGLGLFPLPDGAGMTATVKF